MDDGLVDAEQQSLPERRHSVSTQPITTYRSTQYQHPSSTIATQPFHGICSLGASVVSQVNRQRLESAAHILPWRAVLPRRRARGPAQSSTMLSRPSIADCYHEGLLRVKVKVYPPQVCLYSHLRIIKLSLTTSLGNFGRYIPLSFLHWLI